MLYAGPGSASCALIDANFKAHPTEPLVLSNGSNAQKPIRRLTVRRRDKVDIDDEDLNSADFAYGCYGCRNPGHARSDPYPVGPRVPGNQGSSASISGHNTSRA